MTRRSLRRRLLAGFARYRSTLFIAWAMATIFLGGTLLCVAIDWYEFGGHLAMALLSVGGGL